ncbi:ParA family protein [Helicobacter cetorum]|uniref:ParA family protein n=1 Tax=Helicobacter cetorum TaxID=138563 RepID=UPI0018F84A45|nr:ParA family protein [Helicobacter cetorum]
MSEIIAIANQKGGVGKTTTAVNLAASLAVLEKKILLIDFDPQSNATTSLGFRRNKIDYDIYHVLIGRKQVSQVILKTQIHFLDLIPSNLGLAGFEKIFYDNTDEKDNCREFMLKKALENITELYDYIIIDSPPALGPLTINSLSAAHSVIIPVQCEIFAFEGLVQLFNTIKMLQKSTNPRLKIKGFLPTMYAPQLNLSKQMLADLSQHFGSELFRDSDTHEYITIPRSVRLAESPSFGKPILLYDIKSNGSIAYQKLAQSILQGE